MGANQQVTREYAWRASDPEQGGTFAGALHNAETGAYLADPQQIYDWYVRPELQSEYRRALSAGQGLHENAMKAARFQNQKRSGSLGIGGAASAALEAGFDDEAGRRLSDAKTQARGQFETWLSDPARLSKLREYESRVYEGLNRKEREARSINQGISLAGNTIGGIFSAIPGLNLIGSGIQMGEALRTGITSAVIDSEARKGRRQASRRLSGDLKQADFKFGNIGSGPQGYNLQTSGAATPRKASSLFKDDFEEALPGSQNLYGGY